LVKEVRRQTTSQGVDFSRARSQCDCGQSRVMQSAAAVALMPLLFFCCVHRSSDLQSQSQCFSISRATPKITPSLGESELPSNTCFLGPPECTLQSAFRSVQPFLQGLQTWPTDRHTNIQTHRQTSLLHL